MELPWSRRASDLQTYIAYLHLRQKKLTAHGKPVEDEEMVGIFLKGLHPIYQPLQVQFALPGMTPKKFDGAVEIVRKYSATPAVAAEQAGAVSQHMFPAASTATSKPSAASCAI